MSIFTTFPKYFRQSVMQVSDTGCICVITFWTRKEEIYEMIPEKYRKYILCIGNLYTENGIQYIVKNSLLCPQIKGFVLIGNDKNKVRETFLSKDYYYARDDNFKRFYDTFIETDLCITVEKNTLDNAFNELLNETINNCNWISEPIDCYAEESAQTDTLPSEHQGFTVKDKSLEILWRKALTYIKRFGIERTTSTGKKYREIIGLVSVLESFNEPVKMPENAPLSSTIEAYSAQIITDSPQPGIEYTYGQRLHDHGQIDAIIDKLKVDKANRQAIGVTWNLPNDSTSLYPPCCVVADFKVQPRTLNGTTVNALYLTLYFRSHDIYSAYCANIYGFRKLQEMIAAFTDCVPGYIMIVSNSAHVYDYDYPQALIYDELGCRMDPRGYFIIETTNAKSLIKLTYMSPSDQPIASTTGLDVQQLCDFAMPYISEISHAMYLGRELQRASNCIDKGEPYEQS
jgi:thymidylate synthase